MFVACANTPPNISSSSQVLTDPTASENNTIPQSDLLSLAIQKAYSVPNAIADQLAPLIIRSADQHKISPYLLAALIQQESSFRKNVVSSAGAIGLTQVMPQYWRQHCRSNLFDEKHNIHCGSYILSRYHLQTGNLNKALAYYNVGPTGFEKNNKMRQQGLKYAKSVQNHHQTLVGQLGNNNQTAVFTHQNQPSKLHPQFINPKFNPTQIETPNTTIKIQIRPLSINSKTNNNE